MLGEFVKEIEFAEEKYNLYIDSSGEYLIHNSKDKDGFEVTIHYNSDPVRNKIADEAIRNYFIKL